jgi:hypothetical protein
MRQPLTRFWHHGYLSFGKVYSSNYFCSVGMLFGFDAATPPTPNRYIEWLKIKKNESSADSKEQIAYLPSVGWKIKTDSTLNFWHLFYNNEWYKHKEGTLLMSAILKK